MLSHVRAACVDKAGALIYYLPAFPSRNHFTSLSPSGKRQPRELFEKFLVLRVVRQKYRAAMEIGEISRVLLSGTLHHALCGNGCICFNFAIWADL
jgi:hypothetical protein